jgi:hypothetical protein
MSAEELREKLVTSLKESGSTVGTDGIANRLGVIFVGIHSDNQNQQREALNIARYSDPQKLKDDSRALAESLRPHLTPDKWESYFDLTNAEKIGEGFRRKRLALKGHALRS